MEINSIKSVTNSQLQERINTNSNMQSRQANKTDLSNPNLNPQGAWGGVSINPQTIVDMYRKNRRLEQRLITIDTNQSAYAIPPEALDDVHKKLLGLATGGHLKTMSQILLKKFQKNQKFSIIDDNRGDISSEEESHLEAIKIKRKQNVSIGEGQVEDVIQNMLKENNNPTQRFLLISMSLQQKDINSDLKSNLENLLAQDIKVHGKEISAKVNSSAEASQFGNSDAQKITRFSDTYYELLSMNPQQILISLCSLANDIKEFTKVTNLMSQATNNDNNQKYIPTSDPNTIHDVISFMNVRSKLISLYEGMMKFLKANKLPMMLGKNKAKLGGNLITYPQPNKIL